MQLTLAQKIISKHLVSGKMILGEEIIISVDQTLTQDASGQWPILSLKY